MTLDTLEVVESPVEYFDWTGSERCDRPRGSQRTDGRGIAVSEQAYHRWTKGDKELFFCNHHNNRHAEALITGGWKVQSSPQHDNLDQPLVSANNFEG